MRTRINLKHSLEERCKEVHESQKAVENDFYFNQLDMLFKLLHKECPKGDYKLAFHQTLEVYPAKDSDNKDGERWLDVSLLYSSEQSTLKGEIKELGYAPYYYHHQFDSFIPETKTLRTTKIDLGINNLSDLLDVVPTQNKKDFLAEVADCIETWIVTKRFQDIIQKLKKYTKRKEIKLVKYQNISLKYYPEEDVLRWPYGPDWAGLEESCMELKDSERIYELFKEFGQYRQELLERIEGNIAKLTEGK